MECKSNSEVDFNLRRENRETCLDLSGATKDFAFALSKDSQDPNLGKFTTMSCASIAICIEDA